jgi:hypothetical protein
MGRARCINRRVLKGDCFRGICMKAARVLVGMIVLGFCAAVLAAGPKWPADKYKAFAEAKKKGRLLFLYYHSTT